MISRSRDGHYGWWAAALTFVMVSFTTVTAMAFLGVFVPSLPITVVSTRSGLVMEPGGKVKLRGIQVGRVAQVSTQATGTAIRLDIDRSAVRFLPANIEAQIRTTTIFGAKYIDLIYPDHPLAQRITAGAVIASRNVTTEVNSVFENLTAVLDQVQPAKLNAVITAISDAVRGKGQRLGEATSATADVLTALNARANNLEHDFTSTAAVADTYGAAARNLLDTLSALSTTSTTLNNQSHELDATLLASLALADSGTALLDPARDDFVEAFGKLPVTTDLLNAYSPTYTCFLQGAQWLLNEGGGSRTNGRSNVVDIAFGWDQDPYRYPDHLPVVDAKGGPGGRPSCGALPRPDLNMPVRYLVTDTGFGTGMDIRPNPGIAHPWGLNLFPATKAIPETPRTYGDRPQAIGPVPYLGAPPYGAPLFGSDGTPLWSPPPPGAAPPPVPGIPAPPPPYGPDPGPTGTPSGTDPTNTGH